MDAMDYEYLLRRIYQVGRGDKANADTYRKLEQAETILKLEFENVKNNKPRIRTNSIDDLEYEYRVQCRKIWSILSTAIREGISINKHIFSSDEIKTMEEVISNDNDISKEKIDNIIDTVQEIYIKHQIFPI